MKTRTIKQIEVFPASPDEVYDSFMDPKKHAIFTGDAASGSSEVGGEFIAYGGYITAKNLELVRGKRIVQEWTTSEWPEGYPASVLQITLKKVGEGTELTMVHSKVPSEQADGYEEGWKEHYWNKMRYHFANKKGRKKQD